MAFYITTVGLNKLDYSFCGHKNIIASDTYGQGYSSFKTRRKYVPVGSTSASMRLTVLNEEHPYP